MRRRLTWGMLVGVVMAGTGGFIGNVLATPANGFTSSTIAVGRLAEFAVSNQALSEDPNESNSKKNVWLSFQRTMGPSDVYVQSNTWAPGGSTGWHTHPGHSLITVTAGAVTAYEGDDPDCTPHVYTAGTTFVDPGGDHVHVLRNEGAVEARTVAVQLLPAGATRRIDAADPRVCPF